MTPRLPFLAIVVLGVTGAVLASEGRDRSDGTSAAESPPRAIEPPGATWFCAAGGGVEHTVVVDAGERAVTGRLTVVPGDHAPPPATSATTTSTSTTSSTSAPSTTATPVGSRRSVARDFTVAAGDEAQFRLGDLVDAPLAAAVVEIDPEPRTTVPPPTEGADAPPDVTVAHEVRGAQGVDSAPCTTQSASTWHFAWGATTRDAREQLVLFNPFPNDVAVDAVFSTDRGVREPVRWQGLTVPARSVLAVDVGEDVTRRGHVAASLHVRGGRLVVDRLQSFDGRLGSAGVSVAAGVPEAATRWTFADGLVEAGDAERIVLYNPGETVAETEVVVELADPGAADGYRPEPFAVVVRPGRYEVLDLAEQARVPKGKAHTITVRSTNDTPVVVERVTGVPDPAAAPGGAATPPLRLDADSPVVVP